MIKIGPAAAAGTLGYTNYGKPWDDAGRDKIAQIFVSHGEKINSLQFVYVENGTSFLSEKHGGDGGPKFNVVNLNYPSEYLTGISGSRCYIYRTIRVSSITFITNKTRYGPFGRRDGCVFEYQLGEDHSFGGFHGYAAKYLNDIGVYLKPVTVLGDVKVNIKNERV